ncbi:MAG: Trm112 family protein [Thermoplasmata archaeon]|nr:MAG: Trm112 family protein [Thermoplasmata archaeon]
MKRDLVSILACPQCKDGLTLEVGSEDGDTGEVMEGSLSCLTCGRAYMIVEGIPDLRPPGDG